MAEPWFAGDSWAWLPGTVAGCLCGLWGSLAGTLLPRGKGRAFIYGFGWLLVGLLTASVIAGLTALVSGQPYDVWFFLTVPPLPISILFVVLLCLLPRLARQAEENYRRLHENSV